MSNDNSDGKRVGVVFNIQRFSVHDGPGIRTVVFLKGCSMRCRWCSNPESQNKEPEIAYNIHRCLGVRHCGRCIESCTDNAVFCDENGMILINRSYSSDIFRELVEICPTKSLILYGKTQCVDEIISIVEQDSVFYFRSGGGITLSGGEPLLQREFAVSLLRKAKQHRIDTVVETCGFISWETLREACTYMNRILFDIKTLDPVKHEEYTKTPLEPILDNFNKLKETYPELPISVRTPVVPGFNDSPEEIRRITEFVQKYKDTTHELLPYHRFGSQKYSFLGRKDEMQKYLHK
ncbi:MAG: glycyl-radical enzyme activating protein [Planctomycetaceae bacterium]|jgi:pyruvate formate lyase activating enzyme|nr:glycyl-radical enzyme activating protein [Planctomycetaceae bacterium]